MLDFKGAQNFKIKNEQLKLISLPIVGIRNGNKTWTDTDNGYYFEIKNFKEWPGSVNVKKI